MPPQAICDMYKKYQKMSDEDVDGDLNVVDFRRGLTPEQQEKIVPVDIVPSETIAAAQKSFKLHHPESHIEFQAPESVPEPCTIYEHKDFDGTYLDP